jgi:hypothetical protein
MADSSLAAASCNLCSAEEFPEPSTVIGAIFLDDMREIIGVSDGEKSFEW